MKGCDIILPVWNEPEASRKCIDSIKRHTRYPHRLIAIDNGSDGPTRRYLESLKKDFSDFLLVRNSENLGFVKAVNQGMASSGAPYICVLNNDTVVTENWLTLLIDCVESGPKNIGIANPTSNTFGRNFPDGKKLEWQELDSCRGFCMLIKREVIEKIGLFDEVFGIGYFEEQDFCMRAVKEGFLCVRSKASYVYHKDRLSFDKLKNRNGIFRRNQEIFEKKWGKLRNIAFVTTKENGLEQKKDFIYRLLKEGHRIQLFFPKKTHPGNLKDHIQIRYFPLGGMFFRVLALFKIYKRRKKKKTDFIVTESDKDARFFNNFGFLHNARVIREGQDLDG